MLINTRVLSLQFYEFGAFQTIGATLEIWGTNSMLTAVPAILEIRAFDVSSEWTFTETHHVVLAPNQSTELLQMDCPCPPAQEESRIFARPRALLDSTCRVVVAARLLDPTSRAVIARFADWPQPYRHTYYPDPCLEISLDMEEETVRVSVSSPAKGVVLSSNDEDANKVKWSDNALDLIPGDPQIISAKGLTTDQSPVGIGWQHMREPTVDISWF